MLFGKSTYEIPGLMHWPVKGCFSVTVSDFRNPENIAERFI